MSSNPVLQDTKIDVKLVLSGLWIAMMFMYAYVDIFAFFRADVIEGALDGEIAEMGITINQGFLAAATGFILIPCLMIVASLLLRPTLNRRLNIGVSLVYAFVTAALCIGESWIYYLMGSFVEVVLLLGIARAAWTWPRAENTASVPVSASIGID